MPLTWVVGPEEQGTSGSRDVRISVGRAVATGGYATVDPADIAARPTALAAEQYRRVELDADTLAQAFEVSHLALERRP